MTIHRLGASDSVQNIEELGPLLVTIDDLNALMELLSATDAEGTRIEFVGGYVDEANDIRKLSDEEISTLTIKNGRIEVELSASLAYAVGEEEVVSLVKNSWARQRNTTTKTTRKIPKRLRVYIGIGLVLIAAFLTLYFYGLRSRPECALFPSSPNASNISSAVVGAVAIFSVLATIRRALVATRPRNYAIIKPVSLQEYRNSLPTEMRHRQTIIIGIVGIVCALLGVIIGALLKR